MPALPAQLPAFPRALFFDLDGTLLAPGAVLTRRTVEALRGAAGRGTTLVLATGGFSGRTHTLARLLSEAGLPGVWSVTHNGAAVWDPAGRLVHHRPLPPPALEATLAHAGRRVWVTYETADARVYYAGRLRTELIPFLWGPQEAAAGGDGLAVGLEPRWEWRRARARDTYHRGSVLGCWCIGAPDALAPLDARVERGHLEGARYIPWGARLAQLLNRPRLRLLGRDLGAPEASKGAAAGWLCDRLGIAPQETAAFGDGDNDLELLAFAGAAVVMANATPRALARADLVAPTNREDGVARVLHSWLGDGLTPPA